MNVIRWFSISFPCAIFLSISASALSQQAEVIFVGDHILTMDGSEVSAVAISGDRIIATGDSTEILELGTAATRIVELGDQALLPGFIDAHGHFTAVARYSDLLDLSSPPVGGVTNIDDIVRLIRSRIEREQIPPGETIFGFGYDDSLLEEQRHPNRDDLDRASTQHSIIIRHVSGHLLAANSFALSQANVNSGTENPSGGIVRRRVGSNEPDGVMEETAMGAFPGAGADFTLERMSELRRQTLNLYAGFGTTTVQDSNLPPAYVELLREEALEEAYPVDLVAFITANGLNDTELERIRHDTSYEGGFRLGGVKFILDGSPQGRTAWMSEPYHEGPPGVDSSYVAYPSYDPDAYRSRIRGLINRGTPVLAHANGDEAIELMVDGIGNALAGSAIPDHRSTIIHAQLIRPDQLDRVKDLGIIPSYYAVHPYFWGDWHRLSFGDDRASFISPVAATIERGIPFTIHNDSPIVPPDMMRLISITVNRATRSGYILGPDQRATVEQAIYAVTQGAAFQYFEEDEKGSITVGKRADLVVLAADPRDVDPRTLADIEIVETFARGKSVFKK